MQRERDHLHAHCKERLDIMLGIRKTFLIRTSKHQDKSSEITILSDQNMMGWFVKILSDTIFHESIT